MSQVMSLWLVDDAATRDLMKAYYTPCNRAKGAQEALRQVQLEMLRSDAVPGAGRQAARSTQLARR
ncbi:MAG: CHAT domain-containing protein [Pyrinomonadaceae bacterium]